MVLQRQMDLIANNIANMNTPAYKGEQMVFVEYLAKTDDGQNLSYVQDIAQVRNTSEGSFTPTGNDLDVAIKGNGYFTVGTPLGDRYTRNGRFSLDSTGKLVTTDGYAVLDNQNQPIVVPDNATSIEISEDGTVSAGSDVIPKESTPVGQIKLVQFANDQALNKVGSGLYSTDQTPQPAADSSVIQGMVEESNVQGIGEITHLIATHRAYDNAENIIRADDEMQTQAINKLTQTP